MKISAIRPYSYNIAIHKTNQKKYASPVYSHTASSAVNFQGINTIKGCGIGALISLVGITIISAGAATPLALATYFAIGSGVGSAIGHQVDKHKETK